jgi:hypothetical protein
MTRTLSHILKILATWLLAWTLLACGRSPDLPAEPIWGKEPCAHCSMLVGEPRTAAQAVNAVGDRVFFDDVGCLVLWTAEQKHGAPQRLWVHAATGPTWLEARTARFLGGQKTPMDYGFVTTEGKDGIDYEQMARAVLERRDRR